MDDRGGEDAAAEVGDGVLVVAGGEAAPVLEAVEATFDGAFGDGMGTYRRIAARRGPPKAVVAIEHAILIAVWHMLTKDAGYADPGSDYFTRRNPDRAKTRALDQLRQLGYDVTLTPAQMPMAG